MKKNLKTTMSTICIATMLAAPLAGCSAGKPTAESVAKKTAAALADVKSASQNMKIDFQGSVSVPDYNMTMDLGINMDEDIDTTLDPYMTYASGTTEASVLGQQQTVETEQYSQIEDDKLVTYQTTDGGDTWTKTSTDYDEDNAEGLTSSDLYSKISDGDIEAELAEDTETVDGAECYVLTLKLEGDDLSEVLTGSGMEELTESLDEDALDDASADITVYIDKETSLPAKTSSDLTDLGNAIFAAMLGSDDSSDYDVDMDTFDVEVTTSDYDSVDEISIPDEALDAEEDESSSGLFGDLSGTSSDSSLSDTSSSSVSSDSQSDTSVSASTESSSSTADSADESADAEGPSADLIASAPDSGTADWTSLSFKLDGKEYKIPYSYPDISSEWSFNTADYGYADGYVTNPGDKQACTIQLSNDKYDMSYMVGLANLTDSTQDITENSVWAVSLSMEWSESYPSLELPGSITWGSSLQDVLNAYGQPDETPYYADSLGYYSLTYRQDYDKTMTLIVYDDGGLKSVSFEDYSL